MTWSRFLATGKGSVAWRASVEGWPYEWVTHRDMVKPFNKDGVTGWSAANYYSQTATATMAGSSTMTRSLLFRLDTGGSTQILFEHGFGSNAWFTYVNSSNVLVFRVGDGGGFDEVSSAALTVGEVYVATMSYDGTSARLVVGQTASTPVAASFAVQGSGSASLGAQGGSSPATGCTILGAAATDTRALTDAQMQTHNAKVTATGVMQNLLDGEHLYRAPDLATDLIGSADWTVNGRTTVTTVEVGDDNFGRKRIVGLKSDGFEFDETVDPVTAEWDPGSFEVRIAAGTRAKGNEAAQSFKGHTNRTFLTASVAAADVTVNVASTSGFPSSGVIHVDTEAIFYTGKTSTSFTGCSRGTWGTVAQAHYYSDDEDSRSPEVTDFPQVLEGRRARLYAYGPGDDKQGEGGNSENPIWFGVVSESAKFQGSQWSFRVDGPARLFDCEIGKGLSDGLPIRGIYYSDTSCFEITAAQINSGSVDAYTTLRMSGFWETQAAFLEDLTSNLRDAMQNHPISGTFQSALYSGSGAVRAIEDGGVWAIRYTTDGTTAKALRFTGGGGFFGGFGGAFTTPHSAIDGFLTDPHEADDPDRDPITSVSTSTVYQCSIVTTGGILSGRQRVSEVPRTSLGLIQRIDGGIPTDNVYKKGGNDWPGYRIYLGGTTPLTSTTGQVKLEWGANGDGVDTETFADTGRSTTIEVDTIDGSNRYIEVPSAEVVRRAGWLIATPANIPTLTLGLDFGTGTLKDFLTTITGLWQDNINLGSVPDLRSSDLDLTNDAITSAASVVPYASGRRFSFFSDHELSEIIKEECKLLGVHPAMSSDGKITFRKLELPALAQVGSDTLTSTEILTDDGFLSYEKSALALFNTVTYSTGFDPIEDEHKGETVIVRDKDAFAIAPRGRNLVVTPYSVDPEGEVDHYDLRRLAGRVLGTFGGPYAILTVAVPLTRWSALVGDLLEITWSKVPDEAGGLGVTSKIGYLLSRSWDPRAGRGVFRLLLSDQRVAGYSPEARISSETNKGGNTWTLTLTSSGYFPAGTNAENWFAGGDEVRVFKWDSATAGSVTGEVVSASGNDVNVTFDSTWTPGADEWMIGSQVSTSISADNQKRFAYISRTDLKVHWASSETVDTFTMAS